MASVPVLFVFLRALFWMNGVYVRFHKVLIRALGVFHIALASLFRVMITVNDSEVEGVQRIECVN